MVALGIVLILILVLAGFYLYELGKNSGNKPGNTPSGNGNTPSVSSVSSFKECEAAGYPIDGTTTRSCKSPDGKVFMEEATDSYTDKKDLITVSTPLEGEAVKSPLKIKGDARGFWFFEASFPIRIYDENGKVLGLAVAQAKADWMTEDLVPFEATLNFDTPAEGDGFIVFEKDNPSGQASNDDSMKLPITFDRNTQPQDVSLFLYNPNKDQGAKGATLCSKNGIVEVKRTVTPKNSIIKDTLEALIKGGVSADEDKKGVQSMFPYTGLTISDVSLDDSGVLSVTFGNYAAVANISACRSSISKLQLEKTALQFGQVKSVKLMPKTLFP